MKNLLLLLSLFILIPAYGQKQATISKVLSEKIFYQEDNPQARVNFEILKLKNPVTGKIPVKIRQRENRYYQEELYPISSSARISSTSSWTNRGPYNVGGRTRALAIDLNNENILLAGGVSGGVWRSTNGGQSWQKTTGSNELQSVSAIAQDPRTGNRDTWYYTTGEFSGNSASGRGAFYYGNGVFKSVDNGVSWSALASTTTDLLTSFDNCFDINHEIVVSPTTGTVLIANYCGLYRSSNGGSTWSQTYDLSGNGGWSDVVVDSQGNFYAFARTQGVVFSSNDGGTWTNISGTLPTFVSGERGELAVAPSDDNIVYLLAESANASTSNHVLWRYNRQTDSWEDRSAGLPQAQGLTGDFNSQGGYDLLIKVKPDDPDFVIIGGRNLYRSTDGFTSTTNRSWIGGYTPANNTFALYTNHHPDQHSFAFYHTDPNKVISGNDGGLQFVSDIRNTDSELEPITWLPLNNGYLTTQVYAVSVGPDDNILAGFQDNGTWLTQSASGTTTWSSPFGGDGAYSAFSSDGLVRFLSSQNANIYRTTYSSASDPSPNSYTQLKPPRYNTELFITPFYLDKYNDNLFYLGGDSELYVNTAVSTGGDLSQGWQTIPLSGNTGVVTEMGQISEAAIFVGTSSGQVYKVSNINSGSPTVAAVTPTNAPSGGYVSGVAVNQSNPDEVLITYSNYEVRSIFHSSDGGISWTEAGGNLEENTDGSGNGPSIRTAGILRNAEKYLVGTSVGLYSTTAIDGANTVWIQEDSENIGATVVEHLIIRNEDGLMVAGTHGNGVFSASESVELDMAVASLDQPVSGALTTETVLATFQNLGELTVDAFDVEYSVNGTVVETISISQTLAKGETYQHTFATNYDFSEPGNYTVKVSVSLSGDEVGSNNSITQEISNTSRKLLAFPYMDDFEADAGTWKLGDAWQIGTPQQTKINSANAGSGALMTGLSQNYQTNGSFVASIGRFDFSSSVKPVASFDLAYELEKDFDGLIMAYRTNGTGSFTRIEPENGISNWYNAAVDALNGATAWTGSSSGYKRSSVDLSFLNGQSEVELAFILVSDVSITDEGAAIDNFTIEEGGSAGALTIELSGQNIDENNDPGSLVGLLTAGSTTSVSFQLLSGLGDDDNGEFTLAEDSLFISSSTNFETKAEYFVRVGGTDADGASGEQSFVLRVSDLNEPPVDISISNNSIDENLDQGIEIGTFNATDPDQGDSHSFRLPDTSDSDNDLFTTDGLMLLSGQQFNFENQNSYQIIVEAEDQDGLTLQKSMSITVGDRNDDPSDLSISDSTIAATTQPGEEVSTINARDEDGDPISFNLVPGEGDDNNGDFRISGRSLIYDGVNISGMEDVFKIRVEATDARGGFIVEPFDLTVEEILGLLNLAANGISMFPVPADEYLNLKFDSEFQGIFQVDILSLGGKVISSIDFRKEDRVHKEKLDLSGLTTGAYLIRFRMNDRIVTGRIIKR